MIILELGKVNFEVFNGKLSGYPTHSHGAKHFLEG
jgi:hypothetical protein